MKRGRIKKTAVFLAIITVVMGLCSCGGNKTLEAYYSSSDAKKTHIDEIINIEADNMEVSIIGNEIRYDVVYDSAFDEELRDYASAQIKKELKGMKPVFAAIADITEDETGIEGIKVRISYKDKSGYILYQDTISPDN